jgi:sugar phosphate isomerase/epimerase
LAQREPLAAPVILSTGSLYTYGLSRVFALAAQAGFDGVEVLVDHRWDTRDASYLRQLSDEHDVPIRAIHNPFLLVVPGWPEDARGRLRASVDLARAVGAGTVVVHLPWRIAGLLIRRIDARGQSFVPLPRLKRDGLFDLLTDDLLGYEAATGVTIAVENMPAKRFLGWRVNPFRFNSAAGLVRFPHVTLDTTHEGTWGRDPLMLYEELDGRVAHVHLSNYDGREHRAPQDGQLPLGRLLRRLAVDGYQGAISVEVNPAVLSAHDPAACLDDLRAIRQFCQRASGSCKEIGEEDEVRNG